MTFVGVGGQVSKVSTQNIGMAIINKQHEIVHQRNNQNTKQLKHHKEQDVYVVHLIQKFRKLVSTSTKMEKSTLNAISIQSADATEEVIVVSSTENIN